MIIKKCEEQGRKDGYDGKELNEDNLAGDHDIPRSWGIKAGGGVVLCWRWRSPQRFI